jgi:transcription initiation factor TFIIB
LGVLDGKSPISVVAACLYFVSCLSKEPATARAIADTAQCTEGTLKNAYKLLLEVKEQIGSDLDMHHPLSSLPL